MRKNLVAMLLVGAVAATAVIGLSACGGDSIEKGVEVSEDEWKAAFKASSEAESYTMDVTSSEEATGYETVDGNKINLSYKMTGSGKVYAEKGKIYSETNIQVKSSGMEEAGWGENEDKSYSMKQYYLNENDSWWIAGYNGSKENAKWEAQNSSNMVSVLAGLMSGQYSVEEDGETKALSDLYSAFTYSGGYYSANLWLSYSGEVKVTVSIKDGYVIGLQTEATMIEKDETSESNGTDKSVYKISGYGSTSVSAPEDAVKAIEDAKNNG
ncbi:MAG: hypothetical protein HFE40_00245 [Clostridia bacterium]|jgi:hypothetical protein|nr:hypothetical protein [Clostridia bacterium]